MLGESRERQITEQTVRAAKTQLEQQRKDYERTRTPPPGPGDIPLRGTVEWDVREYEREQMGCRPMYGHVPVCVEQAKQTHLKLFMCPEAYELILLNRVRGGSGDGAVA